jgi:hypothetical protein
VGRYPFDVELFHLLLQAGLSRRFPLIWNQRHLERVLARYVEHYNAGRPHRGIDLKVPVPALGTVTALPTSHDVERVDLLGGLVHEYRCAA